MDSETKLNVMTINSNHAAMIHDIEYDYYGNLLATCSSDGYLHIYDVSKQQQLIQAIKVRDSPIWSLAWAHPRFGHVIATSSFDGAVTIYKEQKNEWIKVATHNHTSSVNKIAWFPSELLLACAASDGTVFILSNSSQWQVTAQVNAHDSSVHGLAWHKDGSSLATSGADKSIKIWELTHGGDQLHFTYQINEHTELVRDIKWHPLKENLMVSGGEDGKLIFHHVVITEEIPNKSIEQVIDLHLPVWKIGFNNVGNRVLASVEGNGEMKTILLQYVEASQKYQVVQEI